MIMMYSPLRGIGSDARDEMFAFVSGSAACTDPGARTLRKERMTKKKFLIGAADDKHARCPVEGE